MPVNKRIKIESRFKPVNNVQYYSYSGKCSAAADIDTLIHTISLITLDVFVALEFFLWV